jgi:O-antigen ligase
MVVKPTLDDYEPLTRKGAAEHADPDVEGFGFHGPSRRKVDESSDAKTEFFNPRAAAKDDLAEPQPKQVKGKTGAQSKSERWVFKQGHTLSYIGLFVFTFLVYCRPYELFPAFFWLSTVPFWIAVFTLAVFVPVQLGLENRITITTRELKLVGVLVLVGLISIAFAIDRLRAWNTFVDYLKVVVMFVVLVNVVRTERRLKGIWVLILLVTCILALGAVNDYRLGNLALRGTRIRGIIGGLFENPNDLALHLVTMIPIAVALAFSSRGLLAKLFYLSCALINAAGVVVTFSRGGFIALAGTAGFVLWRLARSHRWLIGATALLVIVGFIALAPGGYGGRLVTSDDSTLARVDDLKRSIYVAIHHPVFGVGIDNYVLYSNSNHATHNAYTQVAVELGFPAMFVYILLLITPLKQLRKIANDTPSSGRGARFHYLAIGLEASMVGYMIASFFASVAFLWYVYYLIAYAICLRRLYESQLIFGMEKTIDANQSRNSSGGPS